MGDVTHPRRHVSSKLKRADISSVRDAECGKDAPGKALNQLASQEHGQAGGKEGDKVGANHEEHSRNHGLAVTEPVCDEAVEEDADNGAYVCAVDDDCLPARRDKRVAFIVDLVTIAGNKCRVGKEVGHECRVIALFMSCVSGFLIRFVFVCV